MKLSILNEVKKHNYDEYLSQIIKLINDGGTIRSIAKIIKIPERTLHKFLSQKHPELTDKLISNRKTTLSKKAISQWNDPEKRQKIIDVYNSPAEHIRRSQQAIEQWENDGSLRIRMNELNRDPDFLHKMGIAVSQAWNERGGFHEWISQFPVEKQNQIMTAIYHKNKKRL